MYDAVVILQNFRSVAYNAEDCTVGYWNDKNVNSAAIPSTDEATALHQAANQYRSVVLISRHAKVSKLW